MSTKQNTIDLLSNMSNMIEEHGMSDSITSIVGTLGNMIEASINTVESKGSGIRGGAIKEGRMHKLLEIEEDETIESKYSTGEALAKALLEKVTHADAMKMCNYAANFSKQPTIFKEAVEYLKAHPEEKK